jgi:hypothetical protein
MRKVVAILLAIVVVFLVLRSPLFKPASTTTVQSNGSDSKPAPTMGNTPISKGDAPRPSDPAVAAVFDEILAAWEKVERVTAKVEMTMPQAAGHPGKTWGKGEYFLLKKGGKLLIYFTLTNELRIKKEDGNVLVTAEILETFVDGVHRYSLISQPSHREANKHILNYDDVLQIGGPYLMRDLVNNYTLSAMPEEMKDNRATKVIKAKPKDGEWESLHYFDKATGLRVEMIEMGADGKPSLTIKLPQIDTTTTIDEQKFKAVIPPEVPLQDKTGAP